MGGMPGGMGAVNLSTTSEKSASITHTECAIGGYLHRSDETRQDQCQQSLCGRQVSTEKTIPIKLKDGTKITFEREGEEEPNKDPGDVTFVIQSKPHEKYTRDGDDLLYCALSAWRRRHWREPKDQDFGWAAHPSEPHQNSATCLTSFEGGHDEQQEADKETSVSAQGLSPPRSRPRRSTHRHSREAQEPESDPKVAAPHPVALCVLLLCLFTIVLQYASVTTLHSLTHLTHPLADKRLPACTTRVQLGQE